MFLAHQARFRPNTESFFTATAGGSRPQKPPLFVGTVKAEAGQPIQYAMDADDYRSYGAALAEEPYRALLGGRGRLANALPLT